MNCIHKTKETHNLLFHTSSPTISFWRKVFCGLLLSSVLSTSAQADIRKINENDPCKDATDSSIDPKTCEVEIQENISVNTGNMAVIIDDSGITTEIREPIPCPIKNPATDDPLEECTLAIRTENGITVSQKIIYPEKNSGPCAQMSEYEKTQIIVEANPDNTNEYTETTTRIQNDCSVNITEIYVKNGYRLTQNYSNHKPTLWGIVSTTEFPCRLKNDTQTDDGLFSTGSPALCTLTISKQGDHPIEYDIFEKPTRNH